MTPLAQAIHFIDELQIPEYFAFMVDKVQDKITYNFLQKTFINGNLEFDFYQRLKVFAHQELSENSSYSILHHKIPLRPSYFIGREKKLQEIHDFFLQNAQKQPILLLSGIGGMGKTTLMQEYLYQRTCQSHFQRIIYVSVDKNLKSAFIAAVAEAFQIDLRTIHRTEDQLATIKNALSRCEGNNLIVIDNLNQSDLDDLRKMKQHFEETKWQYLITTRTQPDGFRFVSVDELAEEEAYVLFEHHYQPQKDTKEAILALLTHILRHTLLTELLAKVGKKKGLVATQLLDLLKNGDLKNEGLQRTIEIGDNALHGHRQQLSRTSLHTYLLSLFEPELVDAEGQTMLRFFSVLPSEDMPIGDLKVLWRVEKSEENPFEDRLDELQQSGWLQNKYKARETPDEQTLAFKMHPLVQEVVYDLLQPNINNVRPLVLTITQILAQPLNFSHSYQRHAKSVIDKLNLLNQKGK
ncbi:MAG: NB-ARC domain-containing protein [Bacteroidia bacterium]